MIPVVTTSQMRNIDTAVIGDDIATGFSYMLKAGMGLFEAVEEMGFNPDADEIAIACGKGNNGGDGFVVGRMLLDKGYSVMCYSLSDGESLKDEARLAFDKYIEKEGNYFHFDDTEDLEGFGRFALIIDALLGTGTKGNPRGLFAEIIKLINASKKPVIAVDTPSGLDNNTGQPGKPVISANCTVTMGFPKIGQLFYPGRCNIGKLIIKDLGYPREITEQFTSGMFLPTLEDLKHLMPSRKPDGSKFDHGLVFMLCGSRGMTGSAALSAMSALRTGCGMVHCAVPESAIPVLAVKVTEPVLHSIEETEAGTPSSTSTDSILELASSMQAAVIGPGISHNPDTGKLVRKLLSKISIPVVLDADGINAYKDHTEELKKHSSELIITPHRKEWERLFGQLPLEPVPLIENLIKTANEFSMTIIFKGSPTIVANSKGESFILPVGNSGMASAGSGDVLSGIIPSLIAQGCAPGDAAVLGAAIHGLAGETASDDIGEYSVVASDMVNYIHNVINKLSPVKTIGIIS